SDSGRGTSRPCSRRSSASRPGAATSSLFSLQGAQTMAYYRSLGAVPPKRHTQHRRADGGLYYEELMGEEGFSSDSSLLYHQSIPSAIVDAAPWELPDLGTSANHPLRARHLRLHELFAGEEWKHHDVV